jgi:uncharacterized protein YeeX (DUF496 family)
MSNLTAVNFNKYMDIIFLNGTNSKCLSSNYNIKSKEIIDFIILASGLVEITVQKVILLCQYDIDDIIIKRIIENQFKLNSKYKQELIKNVKTIGQYGNIILFVSSCINFKRLNTFKYILEDLNIESFIELIKQVKDTISIEYEKIINDYLIKNSENLKKSMNILNLIDSLINKPTIIKTILKYIIFDLKSDVKLEILNRVVNTQMLNPSLILFIMESNDVIPTISTINILLSKIYFRNNGAYNAKIVAEIIDIFILYGFKITKEIIITMLKKGCYINSIEKYKIPIDEAILEVCAEISYYPYDFQCIPSQKVMLIECGKENNLVQIKKFKEKGGKINVECLTKACSIRRNGKTIKYIINDCKVKPNDNCLIGYQTTNGLEALDLLMQNYSNNKDNNNVKTNKLELDNNSTMSIEPKKIEINNETDYILKKVIKKMFSYSKKTIKYTELYEMFLKYLINKKLVIGNYFLINDELFSLTKISQCTLINIDQIDNLLTYFIDISK